MQIIKNNNLYMTIALIGVFIPLFFITPFNFMLLQISLLAVLVIFYLLFRDITNGLIVWILSLLFVMFTKIPPAIDMPNLSLDRVLYLFLVTFYLLHIARGQIRMSHRTIETLMLILCGIAIFSIIRTKGFSLSRDTFDAYSLLFNIYVVPFSIFIIARDFIYKERQIRKLFVFLSLILLYLSVTSIFEYYKLNALVFPKDIMNPSMGIHFGRSRGPFLQAAINGTVLGMLSVTNLYMAINTRLPKKIFFIIVAILSPAAIFFTFTRAAWLFFMLSFVFMLFFNRRSKRYIIGLLILGSILTVPLNFKIVNTEKVLSRTNAIGPIYARVNLYHTYIAMFRDRPFFGFGFNNFNEYSHEYFSRLKRDDPYDITIPNIHDTFAGTIVELGALGFLIFISILVLIFKRSLLLFRRLKKEGFLSKEIVILFLAIAIVYLLNAFFIDMKYHQFQNVIFYLTAGIIVGLYEKECNEERQE